MSQLLPDHFILAQVHYVSLDGSNRGPMYMGEI